MITIDYMPIQNVIEAARAVVCGGPVQTLCDALNAADAQAATDARDPRVIAAICHARESIADDETEFPDDPPLISIGEDGVWIQSWTWVADEEKS